jgi:hypothetical protein
MYEAKEGDEATQYGNDDVEIGELKRDRPDVVFHPSGTRRYQERC